MAALAKGMPYYGTVCYAYCDTVCYAMPGTVRRMLCRVQYCFCYAMPYSRSNQTASSPSRDLPPCRQQPAVIKCFLRAVMDHCPRLAYLNMAGNTIAHEGASHLFCVVCVSDRSARRTALCAMWHLLTYCSMQNRLTRCATVPTDLVRNHTTTRGRPYRAARL
eukprot:46240-Rhodomonas_salina.1